MIVKLQPDALNRCVLRKQVPGAARRRVTPSGKQRPTFSSV